ncbi:MAG: group 1 glycosyl transferase, partial [Moorea sp. SIO3E2]|nr:group 1 glycosyl transferase [Moorena sp. SIO3E2]
MTKGQSRVLVDKQITEHRVYNMNLRVLIAAEHASAKFGGEAALPLHYYRILRQRGIPTWLVVHERTRAELEALFPQDQHKQYVDLG